jgi:hypothetical protein
MAESAVIRAAIEVARLHDQTYSSRDPQTIRDLTDKLELALCALADAVGEYLGGM